MNTPTRRIALALLSALVFAIAAPLVMAFAGGISEAMLKTFLPAQFDGRDPLGGAVIVFMCLGAPLGAVAGFMTGWLQPHVSLLKRWGLFALLLFVAGLALQVAALFLGGWPNFSLV